MLFKAKGFTLLELIIVIVIIGILATLGFVSYTELMERARDVEAITRLRAWCRDEVETYYLEHNSVALPLSQSFPSLCSSQYYFKFGNTTAITCVTAESQNSAVRSVVSRCLADGKPPQGTKPRYISIEWHSVDGRTEIRVTNTEPSGNPPCP